MDYSEILEENKKQKYRIDFLKKEINKIKKESIQKIKELEEKMKNNNNLLLKIESQNKLINNLEKEKISLSSENDKLKSLNESLNKKLEKVDNPKIHKNLDIIRTGEYSKIINNNIKINSNKNELIVNIKEIDPKDYYDVIIPINSIKDITKGWEIKMSKRVIESYEKLKYETIIKIGVIGNSNKGKTFILSKISKNDLPSGARIRTEGLSIKYPKLKEYKERKIVLIDSAGLDAPVLNEEDEKKEDINQKNEEKEKKDQKKII